MHLSGSHRFARANYAKFLVEFRSNGVLAAFTIGRKQADSVHSILSSQYGKSAAVFIIAVPVAKVRLSPVWAFIPVYQSALVINDLITAVLLFGQFAILRSRALLVLASGYLFTALMAASCEASTSS